MAPNERIRAIRLMERFCDRHDYFCKIGVDIKFRNLSMEHDGDETED